MVALFELLPPECSSTESTRSSPDRRVTPREPQFDRVTAYRFDPEAREVMEQSRPGAGTDQRRARRCPAGRRRGPAPAGVLLAHGPRSRTSGYSTRRRCMAPAAPRGPTLFGFLTMSRRGWAALTPQELGSRRSSRKLRLGALTGALQAERWARRAGSVGPAPHRRRRARRTSRRSPPAPSTSSARTRLRRARSGRRRRRNLPGTQAAFVKGGGSGELVEISNTPLVTSRRRRSTSCSPTSPGSRMAPRCCSSGPAVAKLMPPRPPRGAAVPRLARGRPSCAGHWCARTPSMDAHLRSFEALGVEVVHHLGRLEQERELGTAPGGIGSAKVGRRPR